MDSQIETVTYYGLPTVQASSVAAACNGGTGSVSFTIVAAAGSGPYTYTVGGVAGASSVAANTLVTVSAPAGSQQIVVQSVDLSSCQATTSVVVGEPATAVTFTAVGTAPTCHDGTNGQIVVSASGGGSASYQYSSDNGASWTALLGASHTFTGLASGSYSIKVRNAALCTAPTSVVTLVNPAVFSFTVNVTSPTCNGVSDGKIRVEVTGGSGLAPYTFSLSGTATATLPASSGAVEFTGLAIGTYTISAIDSHSPACSGATSAITVTQPTVVTFSASATTPTCNNITQLPNADGTITVVATGGSGSYQYSSDNGVSFSATTGSEYTFSDLASGAQYQIVVRDSQGCVAVTPTVSITVETPVCLTMCSRSQGYWKNHREWTSACTTATTTCATWCGNSFAYYLDTAPRGNALIIAGKQFAAFVLDFFYYNKFQDIRTWTAASFPVGFPTELADAFVELKDGCSLPRSTILADAALLEQFNSHNSTLYPWLSECSGGYTTATLKRGETASLIKQVKNKK